MERLESRTSVEPAGGGLARLATASDPHAVDLKELLDAYERSLILGALEAVGNCQRRAARLLRVLPSTLHEKMKRLGIRPGRRDAGRANPEGSALLQWRGRVAPGGTLELRGQLGRVRVEAGQEELVEISATRWGPPTVRSAIEVKVLEHHRGVTVCAVCREGVPPTLTAGRTSRAVPRVDLWARVPPGLHVVASTVDDDIEVWGLASNVEAGTANGRVRFLPAPPRLDEEAAGGPRYARAAPVDGAVMERAIE